MKSKLFKSLALAAALAACAPSAFAQPENDGKQGEQKRERRAAPAAAAKADDERAEPDAQAVERPKADEQAGAQPGRPAEAANRTEGRTEGRTEEEAAVVPYYNNFLSQYKLGPEDVISISVFDQPRYSKENIIVPPDGVVAYWFVPDGLLVAGKTTREVAEELTRHLDEFIIDPKVTVSLDKAGSATYAVLGEVAQPGMRPMAKRLTVYEALLQAGGVLGTGNKKKVVLARHGADRVLKQHVVDVAAIERGRAPDDLFLAPGDQIFVPGNRMKTVNKILELMPVISFARIFTGGW